MTLFIEIFPINFININEDILTHIYSFIYPNILNIKKLCFKNINNDNYIYVFNKIGYVINLRSINLVIDLFHSDFGDTIRWMIWRRRNGYKIKYGNLPNRFKKIDRLFIKNIYNFEFNYPFNINLIKNIACLLRLKKNGKCYCK